MSLPSEPKHSPAAVAEPEPLDDEPAPAVIVPGVQRNLERGVVAAHRALGEIQLAEQNRAPPTQAALPRSNRSPARDPYTPSRRPWCERRR